MLEEQNEAFQMSGESGKGKDVSGDGGLEGKGDEKVECEFQHRRRGLKRKEGEEMRYERFM